MGNFKINLGGRWWKWFIEWQCWNWWY